MDLYGRIYRGWYYFRIGYGTYLTFPLGYIGFLALIYQAFGLQKLNLGPLTGNIVYFEIFIAILMTPAGILIGYLHLKHTGVWKTEVEIGVEANPYVYKLAPGKELEAFAPMTLYTLRAVRKIAEREGLLTEIEKEEMLRSEQKMEILLRGEFVTKPKRRI